MGWGVWVIRLPASGPHILPLLPKKFSTSSTSSYLKSTHYDHVLWVHGLFKPCWLTHATCTCFKETALLFNAHLSCFVNFILCSTNKYMFKVNKLVFGNCGSSTYCQSNIHMFNISFCARDHKTNQAISNLNWNFWNKSTQQIKSTTSLTDLCFNKKFVQEKKSLYKISTSKQIYVDTYCVLFVITVTEFDVSSNVIFFLTSKKGGGITSVNYLKMKNDVTYWNTIFPDRNQIHAAPNFLFLSS